MTYASCVYRAFSTLTFTNWNTDRLSTGYVCKNGSFQQTYPTKQNFYSLQAWKDAVSSQHSNPIFVGKEEQDYNTLLKTRYSVWYKELLETKMREYSLRIAQRPTAEPPTAEPPAPAPTSPPASEPLASEPPAAEPVAEEPLATVESFTCPACGLGSGADHRMCICRSYNYSPTEWEIACRLRPAAREVQPIRDTPSTATEDAQTASTQTKYIVKLKLNKKNIDVNFKHICATLEESSQCLRNFVKAWHLLHNKEDTLSDNVAFSATNLELKTKDAPSLKSVLLTTKEEPFRLYITPIHS